MRFKILCAILFALPAYGQMFTFGGSDPRTATFANLGTPVDGKWRFCSNCAATAPCTGSGTGAFAFRVGAAWNCNAGVPALATPVTAANGGTGQSIYTKGDLLAAPGGATLNKLAVGTDAQVLTADAASPNGVKWASAASGSGGGTVVVTSAQFDKTTDATLADIPGLSVNVASGTTYTIRAVLNITDDATGASQIAINGTCTATPVWYLAKTFNTVTFRAGKVTSQGAAIVQGLAGLAIEIEGVVTITMSGTLTIQFAQNIAAGTSSVLVGSSLTVTPKT